jgi:hypothetical protein
VAAKLVLLAAIAGVAVASIPRPPVPLNIRWAPHVTDAERTELERRFGLTNGELREGTTRHYLLFDSSRSNIAAIVDHPAVADTSNIDRDERRLKPEFDQTGRLLLWTIVVALAATVLWELLPFAGRALARPITIGRGVAFALSGGAPALLLAVGVVVVAAAMLGLQPLWHETETPNLAHAAYEEDLALLERTLENGADPDARHTVSIDGRTASVTPIEAAIAGRSLQTMQWLMRKGARVEAGDLVRLQCLADEVDASEIVDYLETLAGAQENRSCDGIALPIER